MTPEASALGQAIIEDVRRRFVALRELGERAMQQIGDEQFRLALGPDDNSVATLAKHVGGNLRSRFTHFLTTDGEKPWRNRDAEFEGRETDDRTEVLAAWTVGWTTLDRALEALAPGDLIREVRIRDEPMSVLQALNRALVHVAQHVGQIVLLAKHHAGAGWQTLSIPRSRG